MRKGLTDVSAYYMHVCVCAFCVILLEAEDWIEHTLHIYFIFIFICFFIHMCEPECYRECVCVIMNALV